MLFELNFFASESNIRMLRFEVADRLVLVKAPFIFSIKVEKIGTK